MGRGEGRFISEKWSPAKKELMGEEILATSSLGETKQVKNNRERIEYEMKLRLSYSIYNTPMSSPPFSSSVMVLYFASQERKLRP